jgi:hypothetical protein
MGFGIKKKKKKKKKRHVMKEGTFVVYRATNEKNK